KGSNLIDLHNKSNPAPTVTLFPYFVKAASMAIRLRLTGILCVTKVNKVFNQRVKESPGSD
ncbi:hypothetical protein JW964_07260, partial [candidate division KSB1 bacterium]|nr:hypothetical protein [candidate division KSB1 bacterium]